MEQKIQKILLFSIALTAIACKGDQPKPGRSHPRMFTPKMIRVTGQAKKRMQFLIRILLRQLKVDKMATLDILYIIEKMKLANEDYCKKDDYRFL